MRTLITGASSGLGAEMARQLAARGHDLVITARRVGQLEELREQILAAHPDRTIDVVALDVTDPDDVFDVFRASAPLDRIIVNAGAGGSRPVGTGGHERNRLIANTNFMGALHQMEAAMELFRAAGHGHLVVISSFTAVRGLRGGPAVYSATKRAVAHLAEGLRAETIGTDIDVTTVYPGYIRTDMLADAIYTPFTVDTEPGVRSMVKGIEARRYNVYSPGLPWMPLSVAFKLLPLPVVAKFAKPSRGE